ncbi:proton-conducting transporter transmembrane domain-containing protein, partial [Limosilactobacillus reuteri]|uniref:proton-conducting transporter transmembrane domain-containing protein n=1 Tax=Limosilactobacillus reuteri TaxID=1598 RepID=UPI002B05E1A1
AVTYQAGRDLEHFTGLGRTHIGMGIGMVIFLLSLVGIPPMAGFFGKLLLFGAVIDAGYSWLAVVGILNSVLSLAVYLRIIVPMYRSTVSRAHREVAPTVVWSIALVLTLLIGVAAEPISRSLGG